MSKKIGEKKEHFSIRKLTVGAASVLIGTSLYLGGQKPATIHADSDDGSAKVTEVKTDQTDQKGQPVTKQDTKISTAESSKTATTSGVKKEETKNSTDENAASEETNKGAKDSEQKESDPTDPDEISDAFKDYKVPVTIRRTIRYHDEKGKLIKTEHQKVTFSMFEYYQTIEDHYGKISYVPAFAYGARPGEKSAQTKIIADKTFDKGEFIKNVNEFKSEMDKGSYEFGDYQITPIPGYYDMVVTQDDNGNPIGKPVSHLLDIPALAVNRNSINEIIDINFVTQKTSPNSGGNNNNPTEPVEPTQPTSQTQPQPTVAPVHPEQPSEPGNVKPKPEKPAAPSHHTNGNRNNNSGSVKPKAQKMPSKAPASKTINRVSPKAVKTTQTVAPKAQTPAAKPANKAALPQTGENNSLSKAAILLGGAAAVIGLIGLAATRKHIFQLKAKNASVLKNGSIFL